MKFSFVETENEQAQGVQEQEELGTTTESQEEVVTLPKGEFTKLNRKAIAYDTIKKNPAPTVQKDIDPEFVSRLSKIEQIEAKRQFGFENQLSPEETDYIFTFSNGKPTKEALENPFVKAGIEGFRQSKRAEANIPGTSTKGFMHTGKTFGELSEAEQKQAFEEDMKRRRG